jgi:hypothetical protein
MAATERCTDLGLRASDHCRHRTALRRPTFPLLPGGEGWDEGGRYLFPQGLDAFPKRVETLIFLNKINRFYENGALKS